MWTNRPILKFLVLFVLLYSAFLFTNEIPAIRKVHHKGFAAVGAWVYNTWHPQMHVDISTDVAARGADPSNDYVLTSYDKKEYQATKKFNNRHQTTPREFNPRSYMAFKARMSHAVGTFFLLSLILATPNSWRRRLIGCLVGLYIFYILVAMKLTFLLEMSDGSKTGKDGLWYALSGNIGNNESYQELFYLLMLGIWFLVSLSKEVISSLTSVTNK